MDTVIYSLCALTSLVCAVMLFRAYARYATKLTFWSGVCFSGLTVANMLLVLDRAVYPDVDLYPWRLAAALAGLLVLVYALIWEQD
jgi:hypothetical protein